MSFLQSLLHSRILLINGMLNLVDHMLEHVRTVLGTIEELDVLVSVPRPSSAPLYYCCIFEVVRLALPAITGYDTAWEVMIINNPCRGDLRLHRNFFQSVMKLASEERIGGHIKRKYNVPKTPYQSFMESTQASKEAKEELKGIYLGLNPAELKEGIEAKLDKLFKTYEEKARTRQLDKLTLVEGRYLIRLRFL